MAIHSFQTVHDLFMPIGDAEPKHAGDERPHDVRIGWVGLGMAGASRLMLRVRRHVDPAWISSSRRAEYAAGLDGCALAMDLVADLEARR